MKPYEPAQLPLDCIDWAEHVQLIGKANGALVRDIRPGRGRRAAIMIFHELIAITERGR
jgi:hypothetical protein